MDVRKCFDIVNEWLQRILVKIGSLLEDDVVFEWGEWGVGFRERWIGDWQPITMKSDPEEEEGDDNDSWFHGVGG